MSFLEEVFEFLIHRPLVMIAAMAIPFILVWSFKRCFPSQRMLYLSLIPLVCSLGTIYAHQWLMLVWSLLAMFALMALLDLTTVVGAQRFTAQRQYIKIASLGKKHACLLTVSNASKRSCRAEIMDDLPNELLTDEGKFFHAFPAKSRYSFEYHFTPIHRGRFGMRGVHLKLDSRWGLWHAYYLLEAPGEVFVYPDLKQISHYAELARTNRLNLMGVRRSRRIGQDNEFERLRDYVRDDNHKHIDWRTTARRQKLTVKDYQANQSQRVIFMLDCGRMMTGHSQNIGMLDQSLNAVLMLAYVALRQGDSVGLICFSDSIHNYTPPRSGLTHINRLLHATFDQHPRFVESRYHEAFYYLRSHCRKRALVVLITNVIDEINAGQIQQYLGHLVGRHLSMGVLLRDHAMFDPIESYLEQPSEFGTERFFLAAAAANIINWRRQVIADLQHRGVMALDVFPEHLTTELLNNYLEIKAKHLL